MNLMVFMLMVESVVTDLSPGRLRSNLSLRIHHCRMFLPAVSDFGVVCCTCVQFFGLVCESACRLGELWVGSLCYIEVLLV